jgi:hypothetical protein
LTARQHGYHFVTVTVETLGTRAVTKRKFGACLFGAGLHGESQDFVTSTLDTLERFCPEWKAVRHTIMGDNGERRGRAYASAGLRLAITHARGMVFSPFADVHEPPAVAQPAPDRLSATRARGSQEAPFSEARPVD